MMTGISRSIGALFLAGALGLVVTATPGPLSPPQQPGQPQAPAQTPQAPPPPPQQPSEVTTTITGGPGAPTRLAVPDFLAGSGDAETAAIAKTIAQVLYDDLAFEREFALIPRDTYSTIPPARSFDDVPFDRWRELGADGLIIGTVQKSGAGIHVEVRLLNVRTSAQAFGNRYDGSSANPRLYAHTISDELHMNQRGLRGVARTKLAFASDRDGERIGGTVETRNAKEIYISDYDGAGQKRVTTGRSLNIQPSWSPDGRSVAYTSFRRGLPNIFVSHIYQGTLDEFPRAPGGKENFQPTWSPDGMRMAFWSTRDGNPELYVADRDGSNVRRLTTSPGADESPTWSPSGQQLAFASDRTGSPQIYIVGVDGLGLRRLQTGDAYAARPTWSPLPFNEIAYSARTGPGQDIKVVDVGTGQVRSLTFGEGSNESPTWAPNGRHLAFVSTRSGKTQVFVMARDGKNVTQITTVGNNYYPDWSR
jgi:TolB protein